MCLGTFSYRVAGCIQFTEFTDPLTLIPFFGNRVPPQALQISLVGTLIPLVAVDVTLLAVDIPLVPVDIAFFCVFVPLAGMLVPLVGVLITRFNGFTMHGIAVAIQDLVDTFGHLNAHLLCRSRYESSHPCLRHY